MPEGDVLRRTAHRLDLALRGQVLDRTDLRWPTAGGVDLTGRVVLGTAAYGKHLLTRFDDDRTLHTHLRMDGSWWIARSGTGSARAAGPFVRAVLGTATWTAVGNQLGMLDVVRTRDEHLLIDHLGPDLLAPAFPADGLPEVLLRWAAAGTTPVCEVLLDQGVVAGIGTIYMAESLFACRLWPWTAADRVESPERVLATARALMLRSIAAPEGSPGTTGVRRAVHGRLRRPCLRCGTPVSAGVARRPPMERPVFYCATCQRP